MLSYEHSACKKPRYSIYKNINSPKCGQGGDLDLQWNLFVHPFSSDILRAKEDKTAERMMRFIPSNNLYVAHQLEPCCLGQPLRSPRAPCSLFPAPPAQWQLRDHILQLCWPGHGAHTSSLPTHGAVAVTSCRIWNKSRGSPSHHPSIEGLSRAGCQGRELSSGSSFTFFPASFSCSFTTKMGVSTGAGKESKHGNQMGHCQSSSWVSEILNVHTRPPINKPLMLIHFLFASCSSALEKKCFKPLYLQSCDCWLIFYLFLVTCIYGLDKQRLKIGSVSSFQRKHLRGKNPQQSK